MQYGFVIDHDLCIGCHACTVACKSENNVPVGSFRTSVKYTETGKFPDVRRHFLVQRCNQCSDAPCVTICPVRALHKRPDGIVDLDRDACIGCKACMQACPYDAIYLNADLGAAEKCHFCAHRVEQGLEPACAVVCPVHAIIPGDFDDEQSPVSRILRDRDTTVRRPEQGTNPNVHYVGADPVSMRPGSAARPDTYIWSDRPDDKHESWPLSLPVIEDARTVLDRPQPVQWGWHVSAYLVTKGIAAGAAMLSPWAATLGMHESVHPWLPEVVALVFLIVTCVLLIDDLARPMKFYRMMTRPNFSSWLVRGGVLLGAFGVTLAATLLCALIGREDLVTPLRFVNAILGIGVAGYTAFLFQQCKGRDLWESWMLLPHLIVQAVLCGGVVFMLAGADHGAILSAVALGAIVHAAFGVADAYRAHETENATQAAAFMRSLRIGPMHGLRESILIGVVLTIVLSLTVPVLAWLPALTGLAMYEHVYVRAGQLPPLS